VGGRKFDKIKHREIRSEDLEGYEKPQKKESMGFELSRGRRERKEQGENGRIRAKKKLKGTLSERPSTRGSWKSLLSTV